MKRYNIRIYIYHFYVQALKYSKKIQKMCLIHLKTLNTRNNNLTHLHISIHIKTMAQLTCNAMSEYYKYFHIVLLHVGTGISED